MGVVGTGYDKGGFKWGIFLDLHTVGVKHFVRCADETNITDGKGVYIHIILFTGSALKLRVTVCGSISA